MKKQNDNVETKINESLRWFSNYILSVLILGITAVICGIILIAGGTSSGNIGFVTSGYGLLYFASTFIGLAAIAKFLSQTAKAIVEGLGGNITVDIPAYYDRSEWAEVERLADVADEKLYMKLTTRQYDAWIQAGQPSLRGYFGSGQEFFKWLSQQKRK